MFKADALAYFGYPDQNGAVTHCAEIAGCRPQAVSQWGVYVPYWPAQALHNATGGAIALHPEHYERGKVRSDLRAAEADGR